MNGDVGKEFCGEQCPTSNPPPNQEMSTAVKDGSNADLSVEKMTDAVASSTEMKDNPEASMTSEGKEGPQNGETPEEENKEKSSTPTPEEKNEDETASGNENNVEGLLPTCTTTTQNETAATNEPLTRDQIKEMVSQNVEYFFSRENWSSDPYLLSQMDSDQYVPVYILANCSQFKSITKDHSIIMDVLKDSVFVQLDEENNRVRPNYKRCIVILREIPKTTPVKEIEAMFEGEGCPKSISCEFVHNDFWYVTFESDSDAQKAYRYLRETVKTFKDKPILARIKTKPMSRIGCLSVLPSYGAKGQGEPREALSNQGQGAGSNSCMPPGGPAGPGIQGGPNPPPPPNAFPPGNPQRMFYPHQQNSINPSYPNYIASSAQIPAPTAYFYPNPMVPWAPNFYDINSFIQYNGLSPRATYKPPTNTRFNNNNSNNNNATNGNINRRNKNRDNRFEKGDTKHSSNGLNGANQIRNSQASSRPQSAHSPHPSSQSGPQNTNVHHSSNSPQSVPPSSFSKGETQNNTTSTINSAPSSTSTSTSTTTSSSSSSSNSSINSSNSTTVVHNSHTFAQNDLCIASQSNLYTSFSPPAGGSVKAEKGENATNSVSISPTTSAFNSEEASTQNVERPPSTSLPATTSVSGSSTYPVSQVLHSTTAPSSLTTHVTIPQIPVSLQPQHHHQSQSQSMTASHRNNFNESHPIRDTQPQRQMTRVGRRRISRRDEDMNGYPGPGGGRGPPRNVGMPPGADSHPKNGSLYTETKKPFELQATSFPPLPSADEVAASAQEEKASEVHSQAAWSGETHKFSDVMKGTAKPKTTVASLASEKDGSAPETNTPVTTTNANATTVSSQTTTGVGNVSNKNLETGPSVSQPGTTSDHPLPTSSSTVGPTSKLPPEAPQVGSTVNTSTTTSSNATTLSQSIGRQERGGPFREQRPLRDDRRGLGPPGLKRDREFVPGIGRGNVRKEREGGGFRLSGNKENRPQGGSSRSWKEDRPDPDGWITKGSREARSHRDHRYQNQQNFYENRNGINKPQAMVNGDSSPPPSPHRPDVMSKHVESTSLKPSSVISKGIAKSDAKPPKTETMSEKENNLNNNEGEHKTSWAKMALASKDHMERLSAELKEKEEQERLKKIRTTKPPNKLTERMALGREREGKPFRRENFTPREREAGERNRDFRGTERNPSFGIKPVKEVVPKSPK